jgi:UDP-N-acetylmuramoyl-tripeptide--D-alanyl-D-alanine ligase
MSANRKIIFDAFQLNQKVTTDTRKLEPGSIFFGLKGESFNGNDFLQTALDAGCSLVIGDEDRLSHPQFVQVENALKSLQELAEDYRDTWNFPVVGITGSNGKTTTKELVRDVLKTQFKVHATLGNLNNHIGVPLTILSAPLETEIAIIEMGANHQKEIQSYCQYAKPTHGYITNIGKAHLEGFGGEEGVKKGKKELYDYVSSKDGVVFVNEDLIHMKEITQGMAVFPLAKEIKFSAEDQGDGLWVKVQEESLFEMKCHLTGMFNLNNVIVAWELGKYFGITPENRIAAISGYLPENMRSQWKKTEKNELIIDAYNANPTSLEHAITHLSNQKNVEVLAIVGEMREMGEYSFEEHSRIVALLSQLKVPAILVGHEFKFAQNQYRWFENVGALAEFINEHPIIQKRILIKGSRGIQLEKILPLL